MPGSWAGGGGGASASSSGRTAPLAADTVGAGFEAAVRRVHHCTLVANARSRAAKATSAAMLSANLSRLGRRVVEHRDQLGRLTQGIAHDVARNEDAAFRVAQSSNDAFECGERLSAIARDLDAQIDGAARAIGALRQAQGVGAAGHEHQQRVDRQVRILEKNMVAGRQRLSEAAQNARLAKQQMQAIGRSNALQVMVQASIEGDMGGLLADVNRHVDRIMAARHDTDEARGQIVALRDAADRQVRQFEYDWQCLADFEREHPILNRDNLFDEMRSDYQAIVRTRHAETRKVQMATVAAQIEVGRARQQVDEARARIDAFVSLFGRIREATGLDTDREIVDALQKAHGRQLEMLFDLEQLENAEYDLQQQIADDAAAARQQAAAATTTTTTRSRMAAYAQQLKTRIAQTTAQLHTLERQRRDALARMDLFAEAIEERFGLQRGATGESDWHRLEKNVADLQDEVARLLAIKDDLDAAVPDERGSIGDGGTPAKRLSVLFEEERLHEEALVRTDHDPADALPDGAASKRVTNAAVAQTMFIRGLLDSLEKHAEATVQARTTAKAKEQQEQQQEQQQQQQQHQQHQGQ